MEWVNIFKSYVLQTAHVKQLTNHLHALPVRYLQTVFARVFDKEY